MRKITPNPKKRGYLLPAGCKDLIDVLGGKPKSSVGKMAKFPKPSPAMPARVNRLIRARKVRVIGEHGKQLGIMSLAGALNLARAAEVDLVEIAPHAQPPVCRLVDYGKFRYELSKKGKKENP